MSFFGFHQPTTSRHASEVASQIFQKNLDKTNVLDDIYNKSNDELWIETWLQQNNIYRPLPSFKNINVPPNPLNLHQAKSHLRKSANLLEKLNKIHQTLEENATSMSSEDWKQKMIEIGTIKDEFTKLMCQFDNPEILTYLKVSMRKRRKKRLNDRKRRDQQLIEKQRATEDRNKLHQEIDQWLNHKMEEVEKTKMEEAMQKDADSVLAEVTKKKSDARKQLSLISSLIKLRTVRENTANQRGEKTSLQDRRAFNVTTEKLITMWENSFQVYLKEEQGLKLMLEKNQTEDSKQAKLAKERRLVEEWKTVLFGQSHAVPSNHPTYWALTAAERELETFIAIRKSWDTFLTSPDSENGSKIPIGWILPDQNTRDAWEQYLDRNALF